MYGKILLTVTLLAGLVAANPMPQGKGKVNQPISDTEWDALRSGGLRARSAAKVNQPITDAEYQALNDGGLRRRNVSEEAASSLVARDSTMNCGHLVTGSGGSNGHGKWVPVQQFADLAAEFCKACSKM